MAIIERRDKGLETVPATRSLQSVTRQLLFTLHRYVALIAGIFVAILGTTGSIMSFEAEIDRMLHPKLSYVTPQKGSALPLTKIGDAIHKAFPGERIGGFTLSASPNISAQVSLHRGLVYVNPYTGEILGIRGVGMDFLAYVHQLHLRLLIRNRGDSGKTVVSWAGVAMLYLLLSGLYLWWPLKRVAVRSGKRFWFDFHNVAGVFSFVFLLVLTVTGLMIGFDELTVPAFYRLTGPHPPKPTVVPPPTPSAEAITPDRAMEIARAAIPGAFPFQLALPGPKGAYQIRCRFPEDLTPGGRSRMAVEQYTGNILFAESSRAAPAGTRLVTINRAIHTGDIFGVASKTIVSLASLMAVLQLISGVVMWCKKRPPDLREWLVAIRVLVDR
jgi:uncharacterized iron-regulated membrane protein